MLRHTILMAVAALFLLSPGARGICAETNNAAVADLNDLISRINDKISHNKGSAADLSDNLKEFDVLLARYKDQRVEDRAQILVMKAEVYLQVLGDIDSALEVFKQFKQDYPNLSVNGNRVDDIIAQLMGMRQMLALRKIDAALTPGTPFPNFEAKDTAGKAVSVAQSKGKVVLVDFWATTCPMCRIEMPNLIAAYEKYHGRGFEIIGISTDADRAAMDRYVQENKLPWRQIHDTGNDLSLKYGVTLLPTSYLIDRDGKIVGKRLRGPDLEEAVAKAVAGK